MRISLESLYIDTILGFEGLNTYSKYSDYITLEVLLSSSCNNSPEFNHDTHRERNKYLF